MNVRKIHFPSVGVIGLVFAGLLRITALTLNWPVYLVGLSLVVLLVSVVWILLFELFPLFLEPFYVIRKRFSRRRTLFVALLLLFIVLRVVLDYLPSGPTKDLVTTLDFLSFVGAVGWFVLAYVLSTYTPLVKYMKRKPREVEKVTVSDIATSVAIVFVPVIILTFVFTPVGLDSATITPYQVFEISLLTDIAMAAYLYLHVIRPKVFTLKQLGLRKVDRQDLGNALALFTGVTALIVTAHIWLSSIGVHLELYSFSSRDGSLLALIALVVIAPFIEELYFRGFLFKGLLKNNPPWIAYVVSALLFALLHPPIIVMLEFFVIGMLLASLVHESKSIWPGVLIHALNNALILGYLLYR